MADVGSTTVPGNEIGKCTTFPEDAPCPDASMDGVFTYISPQFNEHVGKYSIHGAYGIGWDHSLQPQEMIWPPRSCGSWLDAGTGNFLSLSDTPLKINMEPNNCPIEKENHLPNLHFFIFFCSSSSRELARSNPTTTATSSRRRCRGGVPAARAGDVGSAVTRAAGLGGAATRPGRPTWLWVGTPRERRTVGDSALPGRPHYRTSEPEPCGDGETHPGAGLPFPTFLSLTSHCLGHMAFWASQDWWSAATQTRAQINIHRGYIQFSWTSASHGRAPARQGCQPPAGTPPGRFTSYWNQSESRHLNDLILIEPVHAKILTWNKSSF